MLANKNLTIASLFSCGGLVEAGAIEAGFKPIWGVEFEPDKPKLSAAFADCYELNFGIHVIRQRVQDVDWDELESPDILWASPVCSRFSTANTKKGEIDQDLELAHAIADAINILRPKAFCLENVRSYRQSKSLTIIRDVLWRLGYWVSEDVVNAADYGVPQSRVRFILRAVLGQIPPALPPTNEKKIGWYEALADLIGSLPESSLAPWQIQRLPFLLESTLVDSRNGSFRKTPTLALASSPSFTICNSSKGIPRALLVEGQNSTHRTCATTSGIDQPAFSITASGGSKIRALLVERAGTRSDRRPLIRNCDDPCWTIRAAIGTDQHGNNRNEAINAVVDGRVVRLTPRALARLQSVPDWYQLPSEMKIAGPLIGNGVPCKLAQIILESLKPLLLQFSMSQNTVDTTEIVELRNVAIVE